jgi:hypothetical protein
LDSSFLQLVPVERTGSKTSEELLTFTLRVPFQERCTGFFEGIKGADHRKWFDFACLVIHAAKFSGRKRIAGLAAKLQLTTHHVDAAQRWLVRCFRSHILLRLFMLAVQHNFIQGRKTDHVVAACLYIVCRREKTPRTFWSAR